LIAPLAVGPSVVAHQNLVDPKQGHRLEGEAVLALADAALAGKSVPADFQVQWQNEFLKAQRGTFVPFTLAINAARLSRPAVLVYVRAVRQKPAEPPFRTDRPKSVRMRRDAPADEDFPVDAIFPADLALEPGQIARVSRGFTLVAGAYDVYVVVRERSEGAAQPKAAVVKQPLVVPDYSTSALATSSVIVADRLNVLTETVPPEALAERPYVIGHNDITPAIDRKFRKNEELIVVFLVYNPFVTPDKHFDLQVEYHFFRRGESAETGPAPAGSPPSRPAARDGERYFNHTDPQRFTPAVLGTQFDPSVGHPVMAGQGVPLSGFAEGEYRLAIRVLDVVAGTSVIRDVFFTVGS